jgi:hypothetical protein
MGRNPDPGECRPGRGPRMNGAHAGATPPPAAARRRDTPRGTETIADGSLTPEGDGGQSSSRRSSSRATVGPYCPVAVNNHVSGTYRGLTLRFRPPLQDSEVGRAGGKQEWLRRPFDLGRHLGRHSDGAHWRSRIRRSRPDAPWPTQPGPCRSRLVGFARALPHRDRAHSVWSAPIQRARCGAGGL